MTNLRRALYRYDISPAGLVIVAVLFAGALISRGCQ
jgi:hypothetical protein